MINESSSRVKPFMWRVLYQLLKSSRYRNYRLAYRHKMYHHMLIQMYCRSFALRLELTKGTCNKRRTNCACSIVSREICLQLTKVTRDFVQKWIFYQQFFSGYSFANRSVCVSFFVGYIIKHKEIATFSSSILHHFFQHCGGRKWKLTGQRHVV